MLSRRLQRILAKKKKFQSGRRHFKKNKDFKKPDRKDQKKGEPICYECKNLGHIKAECPKLKKPEFRKRESSKKFRRHKKKAMTAAWSNNNDSDSESSSNSEEEEANLAFMANTEEKGSLRASKWYLDSGCSRNMSGNRKLFTHLQDEEGTVTYGDNGKGTVIGSGSVSNEGKTVIEDVLCVKGIKHNLINISQLCDKGHQIKFQESKCSILKDGAVIFEANREKNLYVLYLEELKDQDVCLAASKEQSTELWHRRLGHCSLDGMNKLRKRSLVEGLPKANEDD
ncbi:hypothetical protein Taro_008849 [Colocasia esculenta]|uniref:CCHC-type domain-containing protein n=1 Tax=Colocasia esculenta TaxID=4460 RepID=A0A843U477_COLES|nr:hypothetical protein [Colocasia esculenta]